MKKSRKEKHKSGLRNANVTDFLVIIVILNIMAFTGVALYFYYKQDIPPTQELMNLFFAFFGTELLAMAGIQISKHRRDKEDYDD